MLWLECTRKLEKFPQGLNKDARHRLDMQILTAGCWKTFFFPLKSRSSFQSVISCECWFWQYIRARGNLVWPTEGRVLSLTPLWGNSQWERVFVISAYVKRTFQGFPIFVDNCFVYERSSTKSWTYNCIPSSGPILGLKSCLWWQLHCLTKLCPQWPRRGIRHYPLTDWLT